MTFDEFLSYAVNDCINGESGEPITARPRDRKRRITNPCVDCNGEEGNIYCPDCFGTGSVE